MMNTIINRDGFSLLTRVGCVLFAAGLSASTAVAGLTTKDITERDGGVYITPPKHDPATMNKPWPEAMDKAFWKRANYSISKYTGFNPGITGEHEKWNYPTAMWSYLNGNKQPTIKFLETLDGEQSATDGVDLYWCFTLKGQARKWFFFNPELSDAYKKRMRGAMKKWVEEDPRPTLELVLMMQSDVPEVRAYASQLLHKMKVPSAKVLEWADQMEKKNKEFAAHARKVAAMPGYDDDPGEDFGKWMAWWELWSRGDWKVFEEYERLSNPNPHWTVGVGTGPVGGLWDPGTRGMRADARNTDNLRSMRETTVYLFAEEIGNERTRQLYKEKLKRFAIGLYHVGMGEWDSETYHPHSIMPWLTLYDYAKDPEVKRLAKATLDWLHTAHALKYYRGAFTGPSKRDYGGATRNLGGSAAGYGELLYGGPKPHKASYDDVHLVMSSYRPPLAVANLANKKMKLPVELRNSKPAYSHWLPGASQRPDFFETMYLSDQYTLGTCVVRGGGGGDVAPMKLAAARPDGVWFFTANTGKWYNRLEWGDQRGQHENLLIHVRKGDGKKPFVFQVPKDAATSTENGVWFIDLGDVWVAVRMFGLKPGQGQPIKGKRAKGFGAYHLIKAEQTGDPLVGYAMEVGQKGQHKSFDAFKQAVKSKSKMTLKGDTVTLKATDGKTLEVTRNPENNLPKVAIDGTPRGWDAFDIYNTGDAPEGIWLGWKTGELTVKAGGQTFTSTVTADGKTSFSESSD